MTENTATHTCFDRIIPDDLEPARSATRELARAHFQKISQEHGISRDALPDLDADHPVWRAYMALIDHSRWPDGQVLTCCFLDGDPDWQAKVIAKAKIWERYANVTLSFVPPPAATIRISFFADAGSWSAIGTDCLNATYYPADKPTMNFGWLRGDSPDEEYERVVVHEFGHALGCIHEHQSPNEPLEWNVPEVYKVFGGPPNNWSVDQINRNILQKYGAAGIDATIFDPASIMLYQFAGNLFKNGIGTRLNTRLSDTDKAMIAKMYQRP